MNTGIEILQTTGAVVAFLTVLFVGSKLLPGRKVVLAEGGEVTRVFKLNGLALFLLTLLVVGIAHLLGWFSLTFVQDNFWILFILDGCIGEVPSPEIHSKGSFAAFSWVETSIRYGSELT